MLNASSLTVPGVGLGRAFPRPIRPPERFAFLLLPRFSLMALGCALDALAQANQAWQAIQGDRAARGPDAASGAASAAQPLYDTRLVSADGRAVVSGSGAAIAVDFALDALPNQDPTVDALFVVSDAPVPHSGHDAALEAIARWHTAAGGRPLLGGIGTGAWLLARAGLLAGHRCTVHWPYAPLMAEQFAEMVVSAHVFESDRRRLTCAGGSAAFDMMLHRIGETHGPEVVSHLQAAAGIERGRGAAEPQRVPLSARIGGGQPKLTDAVALMEANLSEPLATEDIARLVGVSRRQLERLFKQYLDNLPSRYYLELRLARARHLLQQTTRSILQVGLSCGFSSGPHFSNAYRTRYGITPRQQRSPHGGSTAAASNASPSDALSAPLSDPS